MIDEAIAEFEPDRSCHTCDFEQGGHCRANGWNEIPESFRDKGCDDWKDEGAPF